MALGSRPKVTGSAVSPARGPAWGTDTSWISWARIAAIVGVVGIHVVGHLILAWGDGHARSWHFATLATSAGRFCVPVFVMVSGALLLRPRQEHPDDGVGAFYRHRAARLLPPLILWTCVFLVFDAWQTGQPVTAYTFVQGFLWGQPYYHLYFVYVVAGLALVTPFLRAFVGAAGRRLVLGAALTCLGLACADKVQHWAMGGGGFNAFSLFVPWIGYYLLGYVVATSRLPSWSRRRTAGIAAAAYLAAVGLTHVVTWWMFGRLGPQDGRLMFDYAMPNVAVSAVAVLILLRALTWPAAASDPGLEPDRPPGQLPGRSRVRPGRVRAVADLTFGIYLIHPIPLQLLVRSDQPVFGSEWTDIGFHVGVIVALLVGCGAVVAALRRIPVLRRLV